ncbi:MAG TPA: GGDEF domain-containing protein [Desulfuromonadales bacterium]|nr:GGDEF domain-containing protein [Desulfuromonadales bacterium]
MECSRAVKKTVKRHLAEDATLKKALQIISDPAGAEVDLVVEYRELAERYRKLNRKLYKTLVISDLYQLESKQLACKLEETLQNYQKLKDVALPICMVCHKIHTTNDYWERLEDYFAKNADIMFSHGICPDCIKVTYGKLGEKVLEKQRYAAEIKNHAVPKEHQEDEALKEMRQLVERAVRSENPLTTDIQKIAKNHAKLLRRFDKIVSLGDSYQSQLRDFNLRLELMAHTDPLTTCNNRGYFMELLGIELERSRRYERKFSALMLDIDHFKSVNDTHGHAAGDEALRTLTSVFRESGLRKSDFFGRIGGEEFALVLPETDLSGAVDVAERVRCNLEKTAVTFANCQFFITASIGVSVYQNNDSAETLLQRADKAMYAAKETGRNRVCRES